MIADTGNCGSAPATPVARVVGFTPECKALGKDARIASCESLGSHMSLPESPLSRMLKTASWPCLRLNIHKPRGSIRSDSSGETTPGSNSSQPMMASVSPLHGYAFPIRIPKVPR